MSGVASGRAVAPAELDAELRTRTRIGVKRAAMLAAGLAVAAGVGWYGYGWWTNGRFIESTDDAYVGGADRA